MLSDQLQAQKIRLSRNQGVYYGGSLPNVNQIGRSPPDFQVTPTLVRLLKKYLLGSESVLLQGLQLYRGVFREAVGRTVQVTRGSITGAHRHLCACVKPELRAQRKKESFFYNSRLFKKGQYEGGGGQFLSLLEKNTLSFNLIHKRIPSYLLCIAILHNIYKLLI